MNRVFSVLPALRRPGLAAALALLLPLAGCGQKGPLTLPSAGPAASQPAR